MTAPAAAGPSAPGARATALRLFRDYLKPRWRALAGALALAVLAGR